MSTLPFEVLPWNESQQSGTKKLKANINFGNGIVSLKGANRKG